MVLWFSRSPANVRDGWCVLQKPSQCEGWLMRSPEAQAMWGMPDAFPRRQRMWGACWYFTYTDYQCPWLFIIDYCYLKLDICNMAHETNKAMSDQSNTLWLAGGEGDQGSTTFFIDTFLLGDQGQVFLFSHLISNLIYALYWNAHFKTIQGTQSGRFFTQSLKLDPIDSGRCSRYIRL